MNEQKEAERVRILSINRNEYAEKERAWKEYQEQMIQQVCKGLIEANRGRTVKELRYAGSGVVRDRSIPEQVRSAISEELEDFISKMQIPAHGEGEQVNGKL